MINEKIKEKIKELEKEFGYLNVELYDSNRGEGLPSSSTIKKYHGVSLLEVLKSMEVRTKDEYLKIKNKPIAISNMKLLFLEHGEVSKHLYNTAKMIPSSEYITKNYGWENIAKEANVKLANAQYTSIDKVLKELKLAIKELGYIPTSKEYESLRLKPSFETLKKYGLAYTEAMRKCGYKTYNKTVKVKDKICKGEDCFRQFTPSDEEIYCEACFKDLRSRLIKEMNTINQQRLKEVCQRLIYAGNKQKTIIDIFNNL